MRIKRITALTLAVAGLVPATAAAAGEPLLPDLVADPPVQATAPEIYDFGGGQTRLLLRFDGFVHNAGAGRLELRGTNPSGSAFTTVVQRLFDAQDALASELQSTPGPVIRYETADSHNHWHLKDAARYSLWAPDRSGEVAPGQKVGFCLVDSQRVDAHGPETARYRTALNNFCGQGNPGAPQMTMGISPGWRDIYGRNLYFQWVDVSDVQPGSYWLRNDVDPTGVIAESDEVNLPGWAPTPSIINGYVAQPVAGGSVEAGKTIPIALSANRFDDAYAATPGALQYRIDTPPALGTLSQPTGVWFDAATPLTYRAGAGTSGVDTFQYSARDASSAFPRSPARAPVTLSVSAPPEPTVTITGAPARMRTSTTAQLSAVVTNAPSTVRWYVNNVQGGNFWTGTISTSGLYRSPMFVPSGGSVTIKAVQPDTGASAQVKIAISNSATASAAPSFQTRSAVGGSPLSRLQAAKDHDLVVLGTTAARAGVLVIEAARPRMWRGRSSCRLRVEPLRPVACKLRLRHDHGAHGHGDRPTVVRAIARLRSGGSPVVTRRLVKALR